MDKKREEEKKHTFLVWLLKKDITPETIETEIRKLCQEEVKKTVPPTAPIGSVALTWQTQSKTERTWWQEYWNIEGESTHNSPNAIILIPCNLRWFALSQGYASKYLKHELIDTQFAYYAVLNSLDPSKITTTKVFQPDASIRQLTHKSSGSSILQLPMFGSTSASIVRDLSGKVFPEYSSIFSSLSGGCGKALRLQAQVLPINFAGLLAKVLERSQSEDYKKHFPELIRIQQVLDTELITSLNRKLEEVLENDYSSIQLDLPDVEDQFEWVWKLSNVSASFECLENFSTDSVFDLITSIDPIITIDLLHRYKVKIKKTEDDHFSQNVTVFDCISFDTELIENSGQRYFLIESIWYEVDQNFLIELDEGLKNEISSHLFPLVIHPYTQEENGINRDDHSSSGEAKFNEELAEQIAGINLDMTNFSDKGQTPIEPCDVLYTDAKNLFFIHNKIFRSSSALSHLFNQGYVSARVYTKEQAAKERLKLLIAQKSKEELKDRYNMVLDQNPQTIILFGIIERKNAKKEHTLQTLPLFSKISLANVLRGMKELSVETAIRFIPRQ